MRIGTGFDVHAFGNGDHVTLGGVRVPHSHGLIAHSDGDVVIHALCDAIFGALALGDIGTHFPPTDERWRNADSRQFLRHAAMLMAQHNYALATSPLIWIAISAVSVSKPQRPKNSASPAAAKVLPRRPACCWNGAESSVHLIYRPDSPAEHDVFFRN